MRSKEPIKTRQDFVSFVHKLSLDFYENSNQWQNRDLGAFLEALAAWVQDMDGYYLNQGQKVPELPDWEMIANMLMAAKIYE